QASERAADATARDALADSERRLQLVLHAAQQSIWEWDIRNDTIAWSAAIGALTGISADRFDGSRAGLLQMTHPDDRPVLDAALDHALAGHPFRTECRIVRSNGHVRWIASHGQVLRDAKGTPLRLIGTVADVTQRRNSEMALREARYGLERRVRERTEELARANALLQGEVAERRAAEDRVRRLLARLVGAVEEERRRIARELHDTFGQQLSLLVLQLSTLRRNRELPPTAVEQANALISSAQQLDDALDRLEYELRPPALDELGLEAAIVNHVQSWSAGTGVEVRLDVGGLHDLRLPPVVETTIYRVVQEALANVRRHAQATTVRLATERSGTELHITIDDDGRGFDVAALARERRFPRGLGLTGMRERAALVAGEIEITSEIGQGTNLRLLVPVNGRRDSTTRGDP
ncbi:MAG: PAS domain-containing sensor histidine kinase, partial [Burkholderiaceae bacterium]